MGEYRDGKWQPTFGDEQFGVVGQPASFDYIKANADLERHLRAAIAECAAWRADMGELGKANFSGPAEEAARAYLGVKEEG